MKTFTRSLTVIAFNIVLFLVLAEGFSLIYFGATEGRLFYSQKPALATAYETPATEMEITAFQFHPYFGVSTKAYHRINRNSVTNNLGFLSPHDYPLTKSKNREYFIGIFGGSVAQLFCKHGEPKLKAALRKHPAFRNRKITLLNFSHGSFKQPQQIMVLSYFLSIGQALDMVINIDGFNEIALAGRNEKRGIHCSMPSYNHFGSLINLIDESTLSYDRLEHLHAITRIRKKLTDIESNYGSSTCACTGLFWHTLSHRRQREFSYALHRLDESGSENTDGSLVHVMRTGEPQDDQAIVRKGIDLWARCSRTMNSICSGNGIEYVQFIQPNQYYTKKTFTDNELENAVNEETVHAHFVKLGYPLLLRRAEELSRDNLPVISAVEVFDDEPSTLFIDSCCHFNKRGNWLLASFIARKICEDHPVPSEFNE